ncbi:MAG: S49 family peptidase [Deltaproteobacteria bacterium]|nr:S49 family peptidase [Deltaproteobacteria bacterium]
MKNILVARTFNRPLLVHPSYLPVLTAAIEKAPPQAAVRTAESASKPVTVQDGIAVIPVSGYLTYKYDFYGEEIFGDTTSYETIGSQFRAALADPSVRNIAFDINSPGGEATGVFDLSDEIFQARGQKPIYAVFNDEGFSAAFAIASAAERRYVSRTGAAGSVGVVALHIDQSGLDQMRGLVYTYIYAGGHKIDYSAHAPLAPEVQALAQEDINAVYDIFVNTVARNLGMTPAAVRNTEAAIYQGKKAVEAGFADAVLSWNQFMTKLTNRKYGGIMKTELENLWKEMTAKFMALVGSNPDAPEIKEAVTKADAEKLVAEAETSAKAEGHAAGLEAGRAEAKAWAKEILATCKLAGTEKMAFDLITDETTVEKAREKIQEARAAEAERNKIISTVDPLKTGEENPVLADAKRRAGTK